jgi:hypothetical protein
MLDCFHRLQPDNLTNKQLVPLRMNLVVNQQVCDLRSVRRFEVLVEITGSSPVGKGSIARAFLCGGGGIFHCLKGMLTRDPSALWFSNSSLSTRAILLPKRMSAVFLTGLIG